MKIGIGMTKCMTMILPGEFKSCKLIMRWLRSNKIAWCYGIQGIKKRLSLTCYSRHKLVFYTVVIDHKYTNQTFLRSYLLHIEEVKRIVDRLEKIPTFLCTEPLSVCSCSLLWIKCQSDMSAKLQQNSLRYYGLVNGSCELCNWSIQTIAYHWF